MAEPRRRLSDVNFWRVLFAQPSRSWGFFIKIALLLALIAANIWFSAYLHVSSLVARVALILPWYISISLASHYLRLLLVRNYLKRNDFPADHRDNFTLAVQRLSFAVTHLVFFFVLLYLLNIPFVQFLTSISLFAVAIVLLFREHIVNFFNGVVVMFSENFHLGDYVKIGENKGRITDITFQNIVIVNDLGDVVFVPNNSVFTREVINFSKQDAKKAYLEFTVAKELAGRIDEIEERLKSAVRERYGDHLTEKSLRFQIERIEKESITISLRVTLLRYGFELEQAVRKHLSRELLRIVSEERSG